ncbi:probable glycosyltransferase [Geomicrobium sp. JCM 19037]|uniref:glycosyltransferase n=1 Tax=Geomicrobium sp. JCM 19037 TaxID=1460634 RepID=UPI00045F29CC|nr:glycosyltransferase [Geomicrobium sp. JCM 19037]GAK03675.1 probable glycosyltransferase [Geomicrobium sp. JCM 19037]
MKTVCFVVTEHPIKDARIFHREAKSLARAGYNVTILSPSQATEREGVPFLIDEITIVPYVPDRLKDDQHRSFELRQNKTPESSLVRLGIKVRADLYHAHEMESLHAAVFMKRAVSDARLVFDSHELFVDHRSLTSIRRREQKEAWLRQMLEETDAIITVSPSIAEYYKNLSFKGPVEVIVNSPPFTSFVHKKKTSHRTIGYVGMVTKDKGNWQKLVDIAEQSEYSIKIIGGAPRHETELLVPDHLHDRIEMTGWVDYDHIPSELEDVDIGWIDMNTKRSMNRYFSLPNKFFSFLDAGVPVIVNDCLEMRKVIEKERCGIVIPMENPAATDYANGMLSVSDDQLQRMGENARRYMQREMSWDHMERRLLALYETLLV